MLVRVSPLRHRLKRLHLERLHASRSTTASSDSTPRGRRRRRATPHLAVDDDVELLRRSRSTTA
jgi:hypothetical protein